MAKTLLLIRFCMWILQVQIVLRDGITDQLLANSIISPITHGQILVWPCTNVPDFVLTPTIHDLAVTCIACYLPTTQEKGLMQSSWTEFYQELVMLFYFAIAPLYSELS
jgi:hypothetical protein